MAARRCGHTGPMARQAQEPHRSPTSSPPIPAALRGSFAASGNAARPPRRPPPRPGPGPRPWVRALGLTAVVLVGAWLGLLIVGNVRTPVGPMDTTMTLRPSLNGGTKINVSPLGALELDSHTAPVRLDVDVDRLDPVRSQALVERPELISGLEDEITHDVRDGTAGWPSGAARRVRLRRAAGTARTLHGQHRARGGLRRARGRAARHRGLRTGAGHVGAAGVRPAVPRAAVAAGLPGRAAAGLGRHAPLPAGRAGRRLRPLVTHTHTAAQTGTGRDGQRGGGPADTGGQMAHGGTSRTRQAGTERVALPNSLGATRDTPERVRASNTPRTPGRLSRSPARAAARRRCRSGGRSRAPP